MDSNDWMSATDAILWHIERDPQLRSTITTVCMLDRPPDPERLEAALERAVASVPRLSQRVQADALGISAPRWVATPGFRVADRVTSEIVDGDHDERALLDTAARIHEEALDRNRPLWELHVIAGLHGGASALIIKTHHAIADGEGLIQMVGALTDLERHPPEDRAIPPSSPSPDPPGGLVDELVDATRHRADRDRHLARFVGSTMGHGLAGALRHPAQTAGTAARTTASVGHLLRLARAPLSPVMTQRSLSARFHRLSRPLADMRATAKRAGVSVNDVFVAAMTAGLDLFHERSGSAVDELRITMPISVRTDDESAEGNHFVPARFVIPIRASDADARLAAVSEHLREERGEPTLGLVDEISELISRTGPVATTALLKGLMTAIDVIMSNVAGVPVPLYMAGARIEHMIPFAPCAGATVNLTLLSYDGTVTIGVNCDTAAVADTELLVACLEDGLDEVLTSAN